MSRDHVSWVKSTDCFIFHFCRHPTVCYLSNYLSLLTAVLARGMVKWTVWLVAFPLLSTSITTTAAFSLSRTTRKNVRHPFVAGGSALFHRSDATNANNNNNKNGKGDPFRQEKRPSLHPLTINTVAEALKLRARNDNSCIPLQRRRPTNTTTGTSTASAETNQQQQQPLQVAIAASALAAEAIRKRQETSVQDDMLLTLEEQQIIAGRVVGIVMRLPDLEASLWTKCRTVSWIQKCDEWDSFGVLADESQQPTSSNNSTISNDIEALVDFRIASDPLFSLNRAECLLALFLDQIESPELARKNVTVADQSVIDFLDEDKSQVLLQN